MIDARVTNGEGHTIAVPGAPIHSGNAVRNMRVSGVATARGNCTGLVGYPTVQNRNDHFVEPPFEQTRLFVPVLVSGPSVELRPT
jgi:hypothetical protein